ncbi:MAG: complex I subunit 5 family protein [bacterium]
MDMVKSIIPFFPVLLTVATVPIIGLVTDKMGLKVTAYSNFLVFLVTLAMLPAVYKGAALVTVFHTGFNVNISFMADGLSLIAGIASAFVWAMASFNSVEYLDHSNNLKRYNILSLLTLVGMLGVLFARNLFSLYIFFEMLSVCSYVMVIHEETPQALAAGRKYLFMGVIGGLILVFSIVCTYAITGTGDLLQLSKMGLGLSTHWAMPYIFLGFIIGFGVKAGMFPVHIWLPDAHPVAPAPASALLSGVMIKAGGYGIIRTFYTVFGRGFMWGHWLTTLIAIFAFINIFLGSAMAIGQTEIKRMLAYSSISQIGYILFGAALLTPLGVTGSTIHIFNHAFIKGVLFMCAGAFIHQTGLRNLEDLQGIGRRMPITTACFTIGGLSMIGLPPFNGFISKWFLVLGAIQHSQKVASSLNIGSIGIFVLLLSSFMNLMYYGPIIYRAWFLEPSEALDAKTSENVDPGPWMKYSLIALAAGIVIFGVLPQIPVHLARQFSLAAFAH